MIFRDGGKCAGHFFTLADRAKKMSGGQACFYILFTFFLRRFDPFSFFLCYRKDRKVEPLWQPSHASGRIILKRMKRGEPAANTAPGRKT